MRVVIALGGNALLKRGEPMTAEQQRGNIRSAAPALAAVANKHELVLSHGNGPQVGLLALQAAAYAEVEPYPLDVLGAQSEGMIGYVLEQELGNELPPQAPLATILTMVEVDPADPAFGNPTKFVGPVYTREQADQLAADKGWSFREDGTSWRRVVPSPQPRRIFEIRPIRWLLDQGVIVICTGGGGVPTMFSSADPRRLTGVEAVIDKDLASQLLAREVEADLLVMATDVDGVYADWGTRQQRLLNMATPAELRALPFAAGSMGPKVEAAALFVEGTGKRAAIGALADTEAIVEGRAGTQVVADQTAAVSTHKGGKMPAREVHPWSTGGLRRCAEHGPGSEDQQQQRGRLDREPDLWAREDCRADQRVPAEGERARQRWPIYLDRVPELMVIGGGPGIPCAARDQPQSLSHEHLIGYLRPRASDIGSWRGS